MSNTEYRKAKLSDLIDWKHIVIFGAIMVIAIVQALISGNIEFASDPVVLSEIPAYSGEPYVIVNDNMPVFGEITSEIGAFEEYGDLDELGRATYALSCVRPLLMPRGERENISEVKPTGWQTTKYDFIDGGNLYNRCHLIAYQLTGENANEKNLITGTRYMNTEGMISFEEKIAAYVKETDNGVLYRATPIYEGNELIARGVQLEAWSLEDNGAGICFNVFCYNVQPGIEIDYATGESHEIDFSCEHEAQLLVLNTNTGKFHDADCDGIDDIKEENRQEFTCCPEELIAKGYEACGSCKPAA